MEEGEEEIGIIYNPWDSEEIILEAGGTIGEVYSKGEEGEEQSEAGGECIAPSDPWLDIVRQYLWIGVLFSIVIFGFTFYFFFQRQKKAYIARRELEIKISILSENINGAVGGNSNDNFSIVKTELYLCLLKEQMDECKRRLLQASPESKSDDMVEEEEDFVMSSSLSPRDEDNMNYNYCTYYQYLYRKCRLYFDKEEGKSSSLYTMRGKYSDLLRKLELDINSNNRKIIRESIEKVKRYLCYEQSVVNDFDDELRETYENYEKEDGNRSLKNLLAAMEERVKEGENLIFELNRRLKETLFGKRFQEEESPTLHLEGNEVNEVHSSRDISVEELDSDAYILSSSSSLLSPPSSVTTSSSSFSLVSTARNGDNTATTTITRQPPLAPTLPISLSSSENINGRERSLSPSSLPSTLSYEAGIKLLVFNDQLERDDVQYKNRAEDTYEKDYQSYQKVIEKIENDYKIMEKKFRDSNLTIVRRWIDWDSNFIAYILWSFCLTTNLLLNAIITGTLNKSNFTIDIFIRHLKKSLHDFLYASCHPHGSEEESCTSPITEDNAFLKSMYTSLYDSTSTMLTIVKDYIGISFMVCTFINTIWGFLLFVLLVVMCVTIGKLTKTNPLVIIGIPLLPVLVFYSLQPTISLINKYFLASILYLLCISIVLILQYKLKLQCLTDQASRLRDIQQYFYICLPRTILYPLFFGIMLILSIHSSFCFTHFTHTEAIAILQNNLQQF